MAVPRVPVPLRPMTIPDILDGALSVVKAAPATVLVLSAGVVVPLELAGAWMQRDELAEAGPGGVLGLAALDTTGDGITAELLLLALLSSWSLSLLTAALALVIRAAYDGRVVGAGEAAVFAVRRTWPLTAAWILVHLAEAGAALALFVPGLFVMAGFALTAPVVALEGVGPVQGMRRAWRLAGRDIGRVLGCCLLVAAVEAVLVLALGGLSVLTSGLPGAWVFDAVFRAAASVVATPFVAAAAVLLYLDHLVRVEGFDLELALHQ